MNIKDWKRRQEPAAHTSTLTPWGLQHCGGGAGRRPAVFLWGRGWSRTASGSPRSLRVEVITSTQPGPRAE